MKSVNDIDFLPAHRDSHTLVRKSPNAFGPVVGIYLGMSIHDWVIVDDATYDYVGVAAGPLPGMVDLRLLELNEICLTPGLKYRIREKKSVQQSASNPSFVFLEF